MDELFQCGGAHNMQPITQITEKFITSLILDGSSQKDERLQFGFVYYILKKICHNNIMYILIFGSTRELKVF